METSRSEDVATASGSCWNLLRGVFSSRKQRLQTIDHLKEAGQFNFTQKDPFSPPPAIDPSSPAQLATPVPSSNAISNDTSSMGSSGLKGLWWEAYEQLIRDPNNAKLVKAYKSTLLQEHREGRGTEEDDQAVLSRLHSIIRQRFKDIQESQTRFQLGGKEIVVRDQVRRVVNSFVSVKSIVTTIVSSEPHAALAWAGALVLLVGPITRFITQDADAADGFESITRLMTFYAVVEYDWVEKIPRDKSPDQSKQQEALARSVKAQVIKLYANILQFQIRLAKHYSRSGLFRTLQDVGAPEDWKGMIQTIETINTAIRQDLQGMDSSVLLRFEKRFRETSSEIKKDLEVFRHSNPGFERRLTRSFKKIKFNQSFSQLQIAPEAGIEAEKYDTKDRCFEGTQTSIIQRIRNWIESPGPEHIFWLHGIAGGGKSTISRTIAAQCRDRDALPDTICLGAGKEHVSLRMQWNHLILQPLLNLEKRNRLLPLTLVVVIDALDECQPMSEDDPVSAILRLLDEAHQPNFVRLKIFLTSRPQKHIFTSFQHDVSESHCCIAGLHGEGSNYDKGRFQQDIKNTLKHKLREIADRHGLEPEWPGDRRLNALSEKADGLWIYASTAWRFIGDYRVTKEKAKSRLDLLLRDDRTPRETVDRTYVEVLQDILDPATPEETDDTRLIFQATVGAIIVLCEPLSMAALSDLIGKDIADMKDILESLSSVIHLAASQDSPIRLVHPSFPEYLTSEDRCLDRTFLVSRKEKHIDLFINCIETLSNTLRRDICQFGDVSTLNCDIDPDMVHLKIPPHVKYACIYWLEHLQLSGSSHLVLDNGPVYRFLQKHLLHWLESLSIMGMISEGMRAVIKLSEYLISLPCGGRSGLCDFVHDIKRFMRHSRTIIEKAPLQVYISALIYTPEQSLVRKQYENAIPEWIIEPPAMRKSWSPLLQTLGGYEALSDISDACKGLALSPDGKLLATSKVEIWDTTTGTLLNTLKPMGIGCSVSFSRDGKKVLSLSKEGNVREWDVSSGRLIKQIKSPIQGQWALAQTFSVDRTRAASYSLGGTHLLLDIKRGKVTKSFKPHESKLLSMALSPNGELLATLCTKGMVRMWNTTDATLDYSFEAGDLQRISTGKVAFCPTEDVIAVLWAKTISIWCLKTHHRLKSFSADDVRDLTFSQDSKILISSGLDQQQKGKVKWWDWASGTAVKAIYGGGQLLQLSPDGRLLASAQDYQSDQRNLINVWDATSGELLHVLDDSTSPAQVFEFSKNGSLLATKSVQEGIRLWDLTGKPVNENSVKQISSSHIYQLYLAPDHNNVAVMSDRIFLWNVRTKCPAMEVESWFPHKALFSPDGRLFANHTRSSDQVWSMDTGKLVCILPKTSWEDSEFTFSPNGDIFAQAVWIRGSPDLVMNDSEMKPDLEEQPPQRDLAMIERATRLNFGTERLGRSDHDGNISHTAWSPDNTHLASVSGNGTVLLWDTVTWTLRRLIGDYPGGERHTPRAIAFSPDGKLLASGWTRGFSSWEPRSPEGGTSLWNVKTGILIGTRGVAASRQTLCFSANGTSIMTDIGRADIRSFYKGSEYASSRDLAVFEDEWARIGNEVILLPNDYHATCAAATDDLLIMGHASGKVTFLRAKTPED
ncbi:hypothetical protein AnigIFM49718_005264 [Aspergillus niger]|nr:hypothetical protein AnigIFM49718_005264 [Aspergillus niger]